MGRIIDDPVVTTLVDGDYLIKDNASTGSGRIDWANLKNLVEIVGRKGAPNGYAPLDADNLVPATHLRPAFTIEEVANAAARDALTITAGEVGKRLVRLIDTGVIYLANATGSGSSKWTTFNSMATATTVAQGVVRLATTAEARARASAITALAPAMAAEMVADLVNTRATAQGLVFDSSAGATVSIPAFGTGDFTILAWLRRDDATQRAIIGGGTNAFTMGLRTTAQVYCGLQSGAGSADTTFTAPSGKISLVSYVRGAGTGKFGLNSIEEASAADTRDYSVAISEYGSTGSAGSRWFGFLRIVVYNYALTPAQLSARYENGGPLAEDFNNASSTSLITGDASTFATDNAFWVKGTGTTISAGKANFTSDSILQKTNFLTIGRRYRASFTVSGYTSGAVNMNNGGAVVYQSVTANGTYTVEFTAQVTSTLQFSTGTGITWALDDVTLIPLGAIFAPEANSPGCGPQNRDMSGNAAHLNLPGDGVSGGVTWAVPGAPAGDFGETRTASGFALGRDAVVIPAGYRIARIWCSGNGTFSIGNAASGTEIVNGFTATATTQPATLAAYTTSSRKLYITLGTATTVTYTVHLERV